MNLVPVEPDDVIAACKIAARVVGVRIVTSVDTIHHCFALMPTQYVNGATEEELLPVRAMPEKGLKWPDPVARLPSARSFVSFSGKLYQFEDQSNTKTSKVNT